MWQNFKSLLYAVIVWSGIMHHIGPLMFKFFEYFFFAKPQSSNHQEADESGQKLRLTRFNGRNYPVGILDKLQSIPAVRIRNDDVILCSYPKAGCHWLHELLHMLVTRKTHMTKIGKEFAGGIDFLPDLLLDSIPSPRILNTHLLYRELPTGVKEKKVKIVFLARNPKDSVVSFFNHHKNLKMFYGYDGNFNDYFKMFMEGRLEYGSYFDYMLDWDKVLKEGTDNPILLIAYEDLKKQPLDTLLKVARFLNLNVTSEFMEKVIDACDFDKMKAIRCKQHEMSGKLYRKGTVGDWRNWLTDAQSEAVGRVWQERMLGCTYQPNY